MLSSYIITDNGIVLIHNGQHHTASNDHSKFAEIRDALVNEQYDQAVTIMNIREAVKQFLTTDEKFTLENDLIVLGGRAFSDAVTDKVLKMIEGGNKAQPLFSFLENVRSNPSRSAQTELLFFCVANGFMITDDGAILAYKSVQGDYTDIHSGSVLNKPYSLMTEIEQEVYRGGITNDNGVTVRVVNGVTVVSMVRNDVDDRRDVTCSTGLHFAAFRYASTWAGPIDGERRKLVLMKVNPRDVVSIPSDYNNEKGRCCEYAVVDEITTGEALPHQEVFCVGAGCDTDTVDAGIDNLESRIAALEDRAYELRSEYEETENRHNEIYDLGGDPSDFEIAEQGALEARIDELNAELSDLNDEFSRLDN
jgi:hypothetical protein